MESPAILEALQSVIHHVFLPPCLPSEQDKSSWIPTLEEFILLSLRDFQFPQDEEVATVVAKAITGIENFQKARSAGEISEVCLEKLLHTILSNGGAIPLHIEAQNAGIIIRPTPSHLIFEVFELSPSNEAVYSTSGRLKRHFPEDAVAVPREICDAPDFCSTIAKTLATMSHEAVEEMQPRVVKANNSLVEERDTTHPFIIRNLFLAILRGTGGSQAQVPGLWKRTREEVTWDTSKLPWRRSPVWLLLRVFLQQTLSRNAENKIKDCGIYKRYMVFLMSKILDTGLSCGLESDMLAIMNAKLGQRLIKLDTVHCENWTKTTSEVVRRATRTLEDRWGKIIDGDAKLLPIPSLTPSDIEKDLAIDVPSIDCFVRDISKRALKTESDFVPPTPDIRCLEGDAYPTCLVVPRSSDPYQLYNLASFEEWTANKLDSWLQRRVWDDECDSIRDIIVEYHGSAADAYRGSPEGLSIMILTVMELWIACDKMAISKCALIAEYPPDIPIEPLRSLLLKSAVDMKRLFEAEQYLLRRVQKAKFRRSALYNFGKSSDFGGRFFSSSHSHQYLLKQIEREAFAAREAKRNELRGLKEEYRRLIGLWESLNHTFCKQMDQWGDEYEAHSTWCHKCRLLDQASGMKIQAHEWPLPTEPVEAQAVVFELQVPQYFGAWRDCTLYVIQNVLGFTSSDEIPKYSCRLSDYSELTQYYRQHSSSASVGLFSEAKPHAITHRKDTAVSTADDRDVCLDTGPRWSLMRHGDCRLRPFSPSTYTSDACTLQLPSHSQQLQRFVTRSWDHPDGEDPNTVIAGQSECPLHHSVGEFKALCSLSHGQNISWLNLLVQLAMPAVNLNNVETLVFAWQLAEQCGTESASWRRITHSRLGDTVFVQKCLDNLRQCLARVKESWESRNAVAIFTILGNRLLSLSDNNLSDNCLSFLSDCRSVSCKWQRTLRQKSFSSQDHQVRLDLSQRASEAAMICIITFDVDDKHLLPLLSDPESAKVYLESLITLQETEYSFDGKDLTRFHLNLRCRRLIKRCHRHVQEVITINQSPCLDLAIQVNWPNFKRASGYQWRKTQICWLFTKVETDGDNRKNLSIHFNLVTGELLVNGLPRGRLPTEYEQHPTYKLLFGHTAFEAMPSADPEMHFTASKEFRGFELQFHLDENSSDLAVRARRDGQMWELLPGRIFHRVLPFMFIKNFVFWYDASRSSISLRPVKTPWDEAHEGWTMTLSGSKWSVGDGDGKRLVFPKTSTAEKISCNLEPLEVPFGLVVSFHGTRKVLDVCIPRLNLDFFMDTAFDRVQSRQYKGMSVSRNQNIHTLIGLKSKLVLEPSEKLFDPRMVLIPDGQPSISSASFGENLIHPSITISQSASAIQSYSLNDHLGQLKGNDSLKSLLFLAELHAVTSGIMPDPFTGSTGTEVALDILSSAAVQSLELSNPEALILQRISQLSPFRTFHPEYLRQMQVVTWNPFLSPIIQSDLFATTAFKLYYESREIDFLRQTPLPDVKIRKSAHDLVKRALWRSLFAHDTASIVCSAMSDSEYERCPNERSQMQQRTIQAIRFGSALRAGGIVLDHNRQTVNPSSIYEFLQAKPMAVPGGSLMEISEFRYKEEYLKPPISVLPSRWCGIHQTLVQRSYLFGKTQLTSWLATLAFAANADFSCLQLLLSFVCLPAMRQVSIPQENAYHLEKGYRYKANQIKHCIENAKRGFQSSPESKLSQRSHETNRSVQARRKDAYNLKVQEKVDAAEADIRGHWPCQIPLGINIDHMYFKPTDAKTSIDHSILTWYNNLQFVRYLTNVCNVLNGTDAVDIDISLQKLEKSTLEPFPRPRRITVRDLLKRVTPPILRTMGEDMFSRDRVMASRHDTSQRENLKELSKSLRSKATSSQESRYLDHFDESISCLQAHTRRFSPDPNPPWDTGALQNLHAMCLRHKLTNVQHFQAVLNMNESYEILPSTQQMTSWQIAALTPHWPSVSTRKLLSLMSRIHWQAVPEHWKDVIATFAVEISNLQATERLSKVKDSKQDLNRELSGLLPRLWDPKLFPDSLLLEVEGNIRIRRVQEDIAASMRDPPDGHNAVMQLNMGEGKSSVIVPIVAASLANGSRLVRVIVAKPQSRQMLHILVSKLGNLMDRIIYQMPMSRSVKLNERRVQTLTKYCQDCASSGGVMLVQPEHLLSFQLMNIEMAIRQEKSLASGLWNMHEFMHANSRDIVDESDENFSTKFELIYTMGDQRSIEHGPKRWIIIQKVLGLISECSRKVRLSNPKGIEWEDRTHTSFPQLRFLSADVSRDVLHETVDHICQFGIIDFPIGRQNSEMRSDVHNYILDFAPSSAVRANVERSEFGENFKSTLLLLRGLFAGGILNFVFSQKRFRVNYGLDLERKPSTKLAVPYRAKDSPSPRSEFSHPDVVVCLTCLSYYYDGLSDDNQRLSLEHLLRSDQVDVEFQAWVAGSDRLPDHFRHAKSINLRDKEQCVKSVFPSFKYSKGAIDYFLSHFVFAKEMKEFPHKLSASGWDIAGRNKTYPLTGFSGTNDSQHVLPVSVSQLELPDQKHTNALVLNHLMQPANSVISLSERGFDGICKSRNLLKLVTSMNPEVRVLLDVGALVLDMTNKQFALEWLRATQNQDDIQGVVFCDSSDEVCVLDRRGQIELLTTSPFAGQLGRCVVFLDEAHTRGIDLRLPTNYRAAVTLGANLTKDRLIQACMRMRKLGVGQSVVFCVPEEIETKIQEMKEILGNGFMTVPDVLEWAILGTWTDLRRSMPLWFTQGKTFAMHQVLWDRARSLGGIDDALARDFLEDEAQTLEDRYQPRDDTKQLGPEQAIDHGILGQIHERYQSYDGGIGISSSTLQEEQERELAPEIEEERQLERPEPASPALHWLHPDVKTFVNEGIIKRNEVDDAFAPAFDVFKKTTAARYLDIDHLPRAVLATKDFERTICTTQVSGACMDSYLRPVQWLLTNQQKGSKVTNVVILSPYEVNRLIPEIEDSKFVTLHMFSPRVNQAYPPLDHLALYTIPPIPHQPVPRKPTTELILFSGQPYFGSFEQYVEVCDFLCLAHGTTSGGLQVRSDGFISPESHPSGRNQDTIIRESPVKFLQALMTRVRRPCESIGKTHFGKLLEGELLQETDFEEEQH